ncbi:unnamed protein product, partial [Choristocarpus tenellus]
SASAELGLTKRHCNYMPGTMHGGAVAVASEIIGGYSRQSALDMDATGSIPRVRFMEVHYMAPVKRRALLKADYIPRGNEGGDTTTVMLTEANATEG